MSFLTSLEKMVPKMLQPARVLVMGNNPKTKVERISISIVVILVIATAVILVSSGVSIFANGFGNTISVAGATYKVQVAALSKPIVQGESVGIVASVHHFIPDVTLNVQICVTEPDGHGTYCDSGKIITDSNGNGQFATLYPRDYGSRASTRYPGEYDVLATFTYVYSVHHASTNFTVEGNHR